MREQTNKLSFSGVRRVGESEKLNEQINLLRMQIRALKKGESNTVKKNILTAFRAAEADLTNSLENKVLEQSKRLNTVSFCLEELNENISNLKDTLKTRDTEIKSLLKENNRLEREIEDNSKENTKILESMGEFRKKFISERSEKQKLALKLEESQKSLRTLSRRTDEENVDEQLETENKSLRSKIRALQESFKQNVKELSEAQLAQEQQAEELKQVREELEEKTSLAQRLEETLNNIEEIYKTEEEKLKTVLMKEGMEAKKKIRLLEVKLANKEAEEEENETRFDQAVNKLKQINLELSSEKQVLQGKLTKATEEKENQKEKHELEVKEYEEKLTVLREKLEEETNSLKDQLRKVKAENEEERRQTVLFKSEAVSRKEVDCWFGELRSLAEEDFTFVEESKTLQMEFGELKKCIGRKISELREQNDSLHLKIDRLEDSNRDLATRLEKNQDELEDQLQINKDFKEKIELLTQTRDEAENQLEEARIKFEEREIEFKNQFESYKLEKNDESAKIQALQRKIKDLEEENTNLSKNKATLSNNLEVMQKVLTEKEEKILSNSKEIDSLKTELLELKEVQVEYKAQVETLQEVIEESRESTKTAAVEQDETVKRLREHCSSLESALTGTKGALTKAADEITRLGNKVEQKEKEIKQLKGSTTETDSETQKQLENTVKALEEKIRNSDEILKTVYLKVSEAFDKVDDSSCLAPMTKEDKGAQLLEGVQQLEQSALARISEMLSKSEPIKQKLLRLEDSLKDFVETRNKNLTLRYPDFWEFKVDPKSEVFDTMIEQESNLNNFLDNLNMIINEYNTDVTDKEEELSLKQAKIKDLENKIKSVCAAGKVEKLEDLLENKANIGEDPEIVLTFDLGAVKLFKANDSFAARIEGEVKTGVYSLNQGDDAKFEALKTKYSSLNALYMEIKEEYLALLEQVAEKDKDKTEMEGKVNELEQMLSSTEKAKQNDSEYEQSIMEMERKNAHMLNEMESKSRKQLSIALEANEKLQTENEILKKDLSDCKFKLENALEENKNKLTSEIGNKLLEMQDCTKCSENKILKNKLSALKAEFTVEIESKEQQIAEFEDEIVKNNKKLNILVSEREKASKKLRNIVSELSIPVELEEENILILASALNKQLVEEQGSAEITDLLALSNAKFKALVEENNRLDNLNEKYTKKAKELLSSKNIDSGDNLGDSATFINSADKLAVLAETAEGLQNLLSCNTKQQFLSREQQVTLHFKGEPKDDTFYLKKYNNMLNLMMQEQKRREQLEEELKNMKIHTNISIIEKNESQEGEMMLDSPPRNEELKMFSDRMQENLTQKNEELLLLRNQIRNLEKAFAQQTEEMLYTIKQAVMKVFEEIPMLTCVSN